MMPTTFINLDIELTNRCNAKCYFCPRDMTPHQGLMTAEIFEKTLDRANEFRNRQGGEHGRELKISLCGLGEPLLNPRAAEAVSRVREERFACGMASNAALLSEDRGAELLDAGLQGIDINVGEKDDDYEEIYKLPFERTLDNVVRFAEMAKDRCEVRVVLVDHRRDPNHRDQMMDFWRDHGIDNFTVFPIMNRGGALFVDHMQFEKLPQLEEAKAMLFDRVGEPLCYAPFIFLFVGYDGQYYLCCSDWKKEAGLGSVFVESFESVVAPKLAHLRSREPVCRSCSIDPLNRLTDELRAGAAGEADRGKIDRLADELASDTQLVQIHLEELGETPDAPAARRCIPVVPG